MNNCKYAESHYKHNDRKFPPHPILHGEQRNYNYDEPLHPCTINYFSSTLIQKVLGSISSLSTFPNLCAFTLQRSADITPVTQKQKPTMNTPKLHSLIS